MTDVVKTYPNGGIIEVYRQVDRAASDYQKVFACCEFFAMQGKKTLIPPHFDETKDLTIPAKRADTFSLMMRRGVKQSERIVVEDCNVGRYYAKRNIYNRIHFEHQNISEVYIRTDKGLELLYQKREG